jgi:hypothetical protein
LQLRLANRAFAHASANDAGAEDAGVAEPSRTTSLSLTDAMDGLGLLEDGSGADFCASDDGDLIAGLDLGSLCPCDFNPVGLLPAGLEVPWAGSFFSASTAAADVPEGASEAEGTMNPQTTTDATRQQLPFARRRTMI